MSESIICSAGLGLCDGELKNGRCPKCQQHSEGQTREEMLAKREDRKAKFAKARELRFKDWDESQGPRSEVPLLTQEQADSIWGEDE